MQMKNEAVKQEFKEKLNPRKRKEKSDVRPGRPAPARRPYTLRIRVKNPLKYIRSLTTDIQPNQPGNQTALRSPTSADLVPKSVEPRVVWLDVRCELSEVNRVGARILECTEFGLSPRPERLHVEQKHAMKGTETPSEESMDLSAELTNKEEDHCLGKPPSEPRLKAGMLQVMQVKIKSISTTSKYSEASKLLSSHSNVAFHSENRTSDAYKGSNASSPNSPLYDMPPLSTPVQKRDRRARRNLQLERWRRHEDAKSRQERYKRRADRESEDTMNKHIQWKEDLVEYFNIIEEPDM